MAQGFKDQNLSPSPLAYFGATCSSLDRILSEPQPSGHMIDALLTILFMTRPESLAGDSREYERSRQWTTGLCSSVQLSGHRRSHLRVKCVAHLLIVGSRVNPNNWSEIYQLYGLLLSFATDSRAKVKRQSDWRLRDVLQSFIGTSLHSLASQAITDLFKRFILLAGRTKPAASEGPKGSLEVLYILDAFECLALISTKNKNEILELFKPLLALQNPVVTRRITNGLYRLCLEPCPDVSPQILLDLL